MQPVFTFLMKDLYIFTIFIKIMLLIVIGYPTLVYISRAVRKFFNKKIGTHLGALAGNLIYYGGLTIVSVVVLNIIGLDISALLGAAGVLGIAVGFAAQTSISNIISGIFLLLERPFSINDQIECDGVVGVVERIDPLSVKLRTQTNQLVRIPNETLIKKSFINHTFYESRRIQIILKIRSHEHVHTIMNETLHTIESHSHVFKDPAPQIFITQVTSLSTSIAVRCWAKTAESARVEKELIALLAQKYNDPTLRISIG